VEHCEGSSCIYIEEFGCGSVNFAVLADLVHSSGRVCSS